MRRALGLAAVLLALTSTLARGAPGVALAWNSCWGQASFSPTKSFYCGSGVGGHSLFASFNPPPGIDHLEGAEIVIDYTDNQTSFWFPCWWNFSSGAPRNGALRAWPVPPVDATTGDPLVACGTSPHTRTEDGYYFLVRGGAGGGGGTVPEGHSAQLRGMVAIPAGTGGPVTPDVQQYAFGFRIANSNLDPDCQGCITWVTLTLARITLIQPGAPNTVITNPVITDRIPSIGSFGTRKSSPRKAAHRAR